MMVILENVQLDENLNGTEASILDLYKYIRTTYILFSLLYFIMTHIGCYEQQT